MNKKTILLITALAALPVARSEAQMMFTIGDIAPASAPNNWPGAEVPDWAIDNNVATKYLNFAKLNTGYVFTPSTTGTVVTGIKFVTANDAVERDPASYILYGSNTLAASNAPGTTLNVSSGFAQISTGSLTLPSARSTAGGDVTFTNSTAYRTYLLVFPTVKDAGAANSMQIADALLQTAGGTLGSGGTVGGGVLSTVPEAGSTALLGLAGLGLISRRRRA